MTRFQLGHREEWEGSVEVRGYKNIATSWFVFIAMGAVHSSRNPSETRNSEGILFVRHSGIEMTIDRRRLKFFLDSC